MIVTLDIPVDLLPATEKVVLQLSERVGTKLEGAMEAKQMQALTNAAAALSILRKGVSKAIKDSPYPVKHV